MARPATTNSEIRSWNYPRQGKITQTVRGSHVDITVRLGKFAQRSWSTLIIFGGLSLLFVIGRIVEAFLSGRAQQILNHITAVN